jgi:hypothetical protein
MATAASEVGGGAWLKGRLDDPKLAIGGRGFDFLFFWGAPLLAALFVWLWVGVALTLPTEAGKAAVALLVAGVGVLTFAHLIAVVPRAYLNREVFESHRLRLTLVPPLLVGAFLISPALLLLGAVAAVLWDVHHSAMQTFGLSRIYDMKAGNGASVLRRVDLRLNWALYVGPIAAGASLLDHFTRFGELRGADLTTLAQMPGIVASHSPTIRAVAVAAWLATVGWAALSYRTEIQRGYRLPAHKAALLLSTASVSIAAWGFATPFVAFAIINTFHAVQYFALVWLKEGGRIEAAAGPRFKGRAALILFLASCTAFGLAYAAAEQARWFLAPFIACSLLHFWYDGFVWSVRKKQV